MHNVGEADEEQRLHILPLACFNRNVLTQYCLVPFNPLANIMLLFARKYT